MSLWRWIMRLGGDSDAPPLLVIDALKPVERLRCLACGSAGPFASCVIVRDYAIRDGQLVSEPSGDRVACQRCGAQFTFSRDGAFQHHAHAEPFTGSARPTNAPQQQLEAPPTPDTPPHAHWPEARKRPPV